MTPPESSRRLLELPTVADYTADQALTVHLTIGDVAAMLGVKASTVTRYKARGDMPAPDGYLSRTPFWTRETGGACGGYCRG